MTNVIYISIFSSYVSDEHGEERNDKANQVRVDPSQRLCMKQEQIINYHCDFYNLESTRISLLYTVTRRVVLDETFDPEEIFRI